MLTDKELRSSETFKSIQTASKDPKGVYKLSLRGAPSSIKELPEIVRKFKNLQSLDITQTAIKTLPGWIGELKNLQILKFSETTIPEIPASVGNLTNLHTLTAGYNLFLNKGNEHIFKLKNLKHLEMKAYTPLIEKIQNLSRLEYLGIDGLSDKSRLEYTYALPALKELRLSGDKFKTLPAGISKLTNLEHVSITASPVKRLPKDFRDLPALKTFGFNLPWLANYASKGATKANTDYKQFFTELAQIKTLQNVEIVNNEIKKLHSSVGLLTQVKKLDLSSNDFKTNDALPKELQNLTNLKELKLSSRNSELPMIKILKKQLKGLKIIS